MKISEELKKTYAEKLKESKKAEKDAKKAEKLYIDAQLSNKLQNSTDVSVTNDNLRTLIVNTTCEDLKIAFSSIINSDQFFATLYNELRTNEKVIRAQNQRSEKAKKRKSSKSNSDLMFDNAADSSTFLNTNSVCYTDSNGSDAISGNNNESNVIMDSTYKDYGTEH